MKYGLTNNTIKNFGTTLYQIKALKDFGNVKKGDLGGWIEKEGNLSHHGNAWVSGNARVFDKACISGNACVSDKARVSGNACVSDKARVSGNAFVSDKARVSGNAFVSDDVCVSGNACVSDDVCVFGNACVSDDAWVFGNAFVSDDAYVLNNKSLLTIGLLGDNRVITLTKSNKKIKAGCFCGSYEEFEKSVNDKYKKRSDYHIFLPAIKEWLNS